MTQPDPNQNRGRGVVATAPCRSCPYRRDVPSGVWDASEYVKLPGYDLPTGEQPPAVFYCHQRDGKVCAGWAGTHDMADNLGVRLAVVFGKLTKEQVDELCDYVSPVPLFVSGREASAHGLAEITEPADEARRTIRRLARHPRRETQ